jgi:hypothetical protein
MNNEERRLLEEELDMQEEIQLLEKEEQTQEKEQLQELTKSPMGKGEKEKERGEKEELKEVKEECEKEQVCKTTCKKKKRCFKIGAIVLAVIIFVLAISIPVYTKDFRSDYVRRIAQNVPYPAMIIGTEIVTIGEVLEEYDTMSAYIDSIQGYPGLPNEEEMIVTTLETVKNKAIMVQLADEYGVLLDETRVDEAYLSMSGGSENEELFLEEMQTIFGMNKEQMIERVVDPLVLSQQVGEEVLENEEIQEGRKAFVQGVHQRLMDGEVFMDVAEEINGQFNSLANGDLGTVAYSELPQDWIDAIDGLESGEFSDLITVESVRAYYLFSVGERTEQEEDIEIQLSVIMVPFIQVYEIVEGYTQEQFFWQFLDEEEISELVNGEEEEEEEMVEGEEGEENSERESSEENEEGEEEVIEE